jgi:hypothetical protein
MYLFGTCCSSSRSRSIIGFHDDVVLTVMSTEISNRYIVRMAAIAAIISADIILRGEKKTRESAQK